MNTEQSSTRDFQPLLAVGVTLILTATFASSMATADIVWKDGEQTLNEGQNAAGQANGVPTTPPQTGRATRPPEAAISVTTNSGDIPVPNWAGVEVEADITHDGSAPSAAPGALPTENIVQITRRREFTLTKATTLEFKAAIKAIVAANTEPTGRAELTVDFATTRVGPGELGPLFFFDGSKNDLVNIGAEENTTVSYFKGTTKRKKVPAGEYSIESDLRLEFSHEKAGVVYQFLDPKIGPEGIRGPELDIMGLDGVLRRAPEKITNLRTGAGIGATNDTQVTYNAATQILSFTPGTIDVADLNGGRSGNVDPAFVFDPLIGASFNISDLPFIDFNTDGRARFGGGTVSIEQGGDVFLEGTFSEFLLGDSSLDDILDSFAVFDSLIFDSHLLDSPLLEALFSNGLTNPNVTTDFYFITPSSLLSETNNLVDSATFDASLWVTGSIAEPPVYALFVLGVVIMTVFRKHKDTHNLLT